MNRRTACWLQRAMEQAFNNVTIKLSIMRIGARRIRHTPPAATIPTHPQPRGIRLL